MPAKYFSTIRNYVLSVFSQRKYIFYHQNTLLDAFRTNSRNVIGKNPSMVIPLLANQDLTPMLMQWLDKQDDILQDDGKVQGSSFSQVSNKRGGGVLINRKVGKSQKSNKKGGVKIKGEVRMGEKA